ncbi:hypothetical protein A33Q_1495 [Indibacter alkaliphilus LW1]|uniref:Uncharacterized protein n=1 Tax=Indibacter alkaliphilus (strain CCUG 57479 / KCTC 22604 / LW1) TaxID=1189612 RepID=S2E783_INDAL|nr:hypothetical protein A33Q_1495 [Indibacter alkaliphilus LW1]
MAIGVTNKLIPQKSQKIFFCFWDENSKVLNEAFKYLNY